MKLKMVPILLLFMTLSVSVRGGTRNNSLDKEGLLRPTKKDGNVHSSLKKPFSSSKSPVKDAASMIDVEYGFPVQDGGLIVEYPFYTTQPPGLWSDDNPWGSFGTLGDLPKGRRDSDCPPIPSGSPLEPRKDELLPKSIFRTTSMDACMLTCNLTTVKATGDDPCKAGSITSPSQSLMTCYDLGESWFGNSELGACGYNCTLLRGDEDTAVPCTEENYLDSNCFIFCDTSTFPGA